MIINKKRIYNVNEYTALFEVGSLIHVVCGASEIGHSRLRSVGFTAALAVGETILPKSVGPVSRFNAYGKEFVHNNQPKESRSFSRWMTDWHGGYHIADYFLDCYPRTFIEAPAIEMSIVEIDGEKYVTSEGIQNATGNQELLRNTINLFLELFGQCELLDENMGSAVCDIPVKRVNWQILPEGECPWQKLALLAGGSGDLNNLKGVSEKYRIETVLKFKPDMLVYGTGGFSGYMVFVFKNKNLVVMENIRYGNATYIFEGDWEAVSQLSKGEIIQQKLMKDRLQHGKSWRREIEKIIK